MCCVSAVCGLAQMGCVCVVLVVVVRVGVHCSCHSWLIDTSGVRVLRGLHVWAGASRGFSCMPCMPAASLSLSFSVCLHFRMIFEYFLVVSCLSLLACLSPKQTVRSLTVALDGSMVVAANNHGTCYVWRMMRGTSLTTHFEPLHKLRAHQVGG